MRSDKYNIIINPGSPDPETIRSHKNFDQLLESFNKQKDPPTPVIRRMLPYMVAATLILAIGLAGLYMWQPRNEGSMARFELLPPVKSANPVFASMDVDAFHGGVYETSSGSRIIVPANAFVNAEGLLISGTVKMKYREMKDFVDFFLTGIPMTYDSSNTRYLLESAGMIEVYAEKDGNPLRLNQGKTLQIALISSLGTANGVNGFNVYHLDPEERNYIFKGMDRISVLSSDRQENVPKGNYQNDLNEREKAISIKLNNWNIYSRDQINALNESFGFPEEPMAPRKANTTNYVFDLDVDESEFPELANYKRLKWEVINHPQNEVFDQQAYEISWTNAEIKKLEGALYQLLLSSPEREMEVIVEPVLSGTDYQKAREQYLSEVEAYQQELDKAKAELEMLKNRKFTQLQQEKTKLTRELESLRTEIAKASDTETDILIQYQILNEFTADRLGIWNCGRPLLTNEDLSKVSFSKVNGAQYPKAQVYMTERAKNTINSFELSSSIPSGVGEAGNLLFWLITEEGKVAMTSIDRDTFDETGTKTYVLKETEAPVRSESELRKILRFN